MVIEQAIRRRCERLVDRIPRMNQWQLDAFTWLGLCAYDLDRGLLPGQIPHQRHALSAGFLAWENDVLDRILRRQDELDALAK